MESLHDLKEPLRDNQLKMLHELLNNLQGNILRGHGRDKSVHMFLYFKEDKRHEVKQWIKQLADRITSVQRQLDESKQYQQYGIPGQIFISFFLSAKGYEYLLPNSQSRFNDEAFLLGMQAAQHRLNDPPPETWEKGYQQAHNAYIHAMILLAADDEQALLGEARQLLSQLQNPDKVLAEIHAVEHGRVMRNAQGNTIEHFGYADSLSQPLFFESDIERARQQGERTHIWNPGAGPNIVLVPDPYAPKAYASHAYGSFLVFRKLEQNVQAFKDHEQKLAQTLGLTGEDVTRAGALVMGRFEDGTPVVVQPTAGRPTNSFTYHDDPDGEKCPMQAHIRKVNPRQQGIPRIVRRGISYGTRQKEPKDHPRLEELPTKNVGLLFMCYQKNIAKQFEFLQHVWANNPRFPAKQPPGLDAIIGQSVGRGVGQQKWPARWNDLREKHRSFDFQSFVTLKGGEYFFAPSIPFLKHL